MVFSRHEKKTELYDNFEHMNTFYIDFKKT